MVAFKMRDSVPSARYSSVCVMYCVYGASSSSLLIESTDSMIRVHNNYTKEDYLTLYITVLQPLGGFTSFVAILYTVIHDIHVALNSCGFS